MIPKNRQLEYRIREDLSLIYLSGVSARILSLITKRLIGRILSHEGVSKANSFLTEGIEKWRNRDLPKEAIKSLHLDGVLICESMEALKKFLF